MLLIWWKWKVISYDRDSNGNEELPAGGFDDDDVLFSDLIEQGQQICMDVARITDEDEFEDLQGTKIAVQYAAAYLYEHREEADHHQLVMDLRSLLFGVRKPGF